MRSNTGVLYFDDIKLIATSSSASAGAATTTVRYVANDQLGGSSVVTNSGGTVVQVLDYYPYGGLRMDSTTDYGGVRNKYAGTVYDALSGLNYMQARYQNSSRGQFISQDPIFLGDLSQQNLKDPQSLNSYSYANGNPLTKRDPDGRYATAVAQAAPLIVGTGALLSPETLGVSALLASGILGLMYLTEHGNSLPRFPDGTPGYYHAKKLVEGIGASPDPQPPFNRPPGRWGGLALTSIVTGTLVWVGTEIAQHAQTTSNYAASLHFMQNYNDWPSQPGSNVNKIEYAQNVSKSISTGQPSYTGPSSGGSNPGYMNQTYVTPNGAVIDWGGNVIVPGRNN